MSFVINDKIRMYSKLSDDYHKDELGKLDYTMRMRFPFDKSQFIEAEKYQNM